MKKAVQAFISTMYIVGVFGAVSTAVVTYLPTGAHIPVYILITIIFGILLNRE